MRTRRAGRVAVLGAGLQGTCVALELASRGFEVALIERDAVALNRASLRNEAKIHLGFVYAKDPTLRTARSMLDGALCFGPLLSRWTSGGEADIRRSTSFVYLVPNDSQSSLDELSEHFEALQRSYDEIRAHGEPDYLGTSPRCLFRPLGRRDFESYADADRLLGGFQTVEAAIDMATTATLLRAAIARNPGIELLTGHTVEAVGRTSSGFRVAGRDPDGAAWRSEYAQVVNALWDGRLAIDEGFGVSPTRPWVYRLRYRLLVDLPPEIRRMPSLTFVLGAYGDIVTHAEGPAYVSWYPECMRGWSDALAPPAEWAAACRGELPRSEQLVLGRQVLESFDALVPGLARSRIRAVDAGVIFAWGETDITDRGSELHRRDQIGVTAHDGYHSVDTGKLTTAPMFAFEVGHRVCRYAQ